MSQIRAFVGHSFNEGDQPVVGAFLKILDGIGTALPGFSWKHADRPEPKIVTEKVLELLSDRNVFIGICTRKERVVQDVQLKRQVFNRGVFSIPESALQWKTSDWVIQEIGLAIGRGLKIVLLLECGVRLPGELQGNLEHIPFDRNSPERAFEKLLLMLSSITTEVATAAEVVPLHGETEAISNKAPETREHSSIEAPSPGWSQERLEISVLRAVITKDNNRLKQADEAFRASPLYQQEDNAACWDAYNEYVNLRFGTGGSIDRLKDLSEQFPGSSRIKNYISVVLESYEEFSEAIVWVQRAAEVSVDPLSKLKYLGRVAKLMAASKQESAAAEVVAKMKVLGQSIGDSEDVLLRVELNLAEQESDAEMEVAVMERQLELAPTDDSTRFSLAFKYSELGRNELSMLHYSRIPSRNRTGAAWNNLGVALDRLGMPAKAIDAYREAEHRGETLAMSNLANKQIAAGFLREAAEICELAVQLPDHHKNVDASLGRLKEVPEEETKKEGSVLDMARGLSSVYRDVGKLSTKIQPPIAVNWRGPDCPLRATQVGETVQFSGEYQQERLLSSLMMGLGSSAEQKMQDYKVEYSGKLHGRTFIGTVARSAASGPARTLLGSYEPASNKVVMLLRTDQTAEVIEFTSDESHKDYQLTAI